METFEFCTTQRRRGIWRFAVLALSLCGLGAVTGLTWNFQTASGSLDGARQAAIGASAQRRIVAIVEILRDAQKSIDALEQVAIEDGQIGEQARAALSQLRKRLVR